MDRKAEFQELAKTCVSLEAYIDVLIFLDIDNKFNLGRKRVLKEFTEIVIDRNPQFKKQIAYILKIYMIARYTL